MKFLKAVVLVVLLSGWALAEQDYDKYTYPIVEKSVSAKTISYEELRAIYTLSITRWPDGTKITVVTLPNDHPAQRKFLWEYFGLSAARYSEIITNKTLPGMPARKPVEAKSEIEVIQKVSHTKGAIGFIDGNVRLSKNENVRTVNIR